MGHHLNDKGFFQSDKHPELPENKILLDFRDESAQKALEVYAALCAGHDRQLSDDILQSIRNVRRADEKTRLIIPLKLTT